MTRVDSAGDRAGEALEVDVAVVGAGLAGLSTAHSLREAGARVIVLEARERVGGRLLNALLGDEVIADAGGAWMGAGHDRLAALGRSSEEAARADMDLVEARG